MVLASPIGGALTGKVKPKYVIFASTFVAMVGIFMFSILLDARSTAIDIIIPLVIMAFGMGFGMAQRTSVVAAVVPSDEIGVASSILALARNIAQAFGIAVFSTILTDTVNRNVLNIAYRSVIRIANPQIYQQAVGLIILAAQIDAYKTVFVWAASTLILGTCLSLFINVSKEKMRGGAHKEEVFIEV
jgi:MFS family permease